MDEKEKELDYVISLIDYDLKLNFVGDKYLKIICDSACDGDLKARLWLAETINKYSLPLVLQDYNVENGKNGNMLLSDIKSYIRIISDKVDNEASFSFVIKKIVHIFVELKKRYSYHQYNKQQYLILTAIIIAEFWYTGDQFQEISTLPNFLAFVFDGDFFYKGNEYSLFDYPEIKDEFEDDSDALTRLCFGLFISYRDNKLHVHDDTLVTAPIFGYDIIEKIVRKEIENLGPFDTFDAYTIIEQFLVRENYNIAWLNGYREDVFFLNRGHEGKKRGGLKSKTESILLSFNFNLHCTLYNFVFAKEYNVDLNDLYGEEMVVRNLLSICYQYLEGMGMEIENANEWNDLPIEFFCYNSTKGICIGLPRYEISSLSKYICFLFNDDKKVYYSADFLEEDDFFEIRLKGEDGICINTFERISTDSSMKEFFEVVSKHFEKNYESD